MSLLQGCGRRMGVQWFWWSLGGESVFQQDNEKGMIKVRIGYLRATAFLVFPSNKEQCLYNPTIKEGKARGSGRKGESYPGVKAS